MKTNAIDQTLGVPLATDSTQEIDAMPTAPVVISAAGKWHWYRAALPWGGLTVALWPTEQLLSLARQPDAEERLLDAACVLGRDESLLESLEEWLGTPLDLEPVESPAQFHAQMMVTSQGHGLDGGEGCALLAMPPELLRRLASPPATLQEHHDLRWGAVPCRLILDRMGISEEQLCELETGSLLLLPASFEPRWRCGIMSEKDVALQAALFLEVDESCLEFLSVLEREPAEDGEVSIEVHCAEPLAIPLDWLLGRSSSPRTLLTRLLSSCTVDVFQKGDRIASGSLLPVGRGYGVFIQERKEIALWT